MNQVKKLYKTIMSIPVFLAIIALIFSIIIKSSLHEIIIYREIIAIALVTVLSTLCLNNRFNKKFQIEFITSYTSIFLLRDLMILLLVAITPFGMAELILKTNKIIILLIGKIFLRIFISFTILNLFNLITLKLTKLVDKKNISKRLKDIILKPIPIICIIIIILLSLIYLEQNTINGKFEKLAQIEANIFTSNIVVLNNNKLFVTDINHNKQIEYYIYNPFTKQKEVTGIIENPRYSDIQTKALKNGNVFIIGANYPNENQNLRGIIYNPSNNTTKLTPIIPNPNYTGSILELPDNKLFITGGEGECKTVQLYDIQNNTFEKLPDMNNSRRSHSSILLKNNKILLIGGDSKEPEIYDLQSKKSTNIDIGFSTTSHDINSKALLLNNGKIFILCTRKYLEDDGYGTKCCDFINKETYYPFTYIGIFDPNTNKIQDLQCGSKKHKMDAYNITQLKDGRILITGGRIGRGINMGYKVLNTAQIYDNSTNKFYRVNHKLNISRYAHNSETLNDGRVLIWGGVNNNSINIKEIELFTLK